MVIHVDFIGEYVGVGQSDKNIQRSVHVSNANIVLLVSLHLRTAITIGNTQFTILNSAVGGHFDFDLNDIRVSSPFRMSSLSRNELCCRSSQSICLLAVASVSNEWCRIRAVSSYRRKAIRTPN